MKVKFFTDRGDALKVEEEINNWLSEKNISMSSSQFKQSYIYDSKNNMSSVLISVWYEPDFEK